MEFHAVAANFMNLPTAKEVRDYLNYLTKFKKEIKFPMSLEIDDGLYIIYDGDNKPVAYMSKKVYDLFQEL